MATRLTGFSKLLITLLILALIVGAGWYLLNKTSFGQNLQDKADEINAEIDDNSSNNNSISGMNIDDETLVVQIFTWGGYAPGLYFNEGASPNKNSRYYKDYGLKVKFELIDDFNASRQAWRADEVHLLGGTIDALAPELEGLGAFDPMAVMQVDWSRGGDAIIAKRGVNNINDLKGKKVAVTPATPSQTFLITALDAAGLTISDIDLIETPGNPEAALAFKAGEVDAAVVWSPDDILSVRAVPGSKVLQSTREASHIIADVFYAKKDFINANKDKINAFYEGWMKAAAEINANASNKNKAAKIVGETMGLSTEDAMGAIDNVRLCNHGDNLNFYGLNTDYKGVTGEMLYSKMGRRFQQLGFAPDRIPSPRQVLYSGGAQAASLTGPTHRSEVAKEFAPATENDKTVAAISSKPISITFPTGKYQLSENAKTIIDLQFADVARSFSNMRVRVEGNTDNVGGRAMNMDLSKKRAQSVADYLRSTYGYAKNRMIVVGNGPDKPVPGCETNATDECKSKNRRTEFQLIAG